MDELAFATTEPAARIPGAARVSSASRTRVQALGGRISVESPPGAGTSVRAQLPLD